MRFSLLGIDAQTWQLVDALARSTEHSLVSAFEVDSDADQLTGVVPGVQFGRSWQSLIGTTTADAVIVACAADEERRAEQLRKLVQAGMPMLIAHPVNGSVLVYYELDMIRQDSQCVMIPFLTARLHPAVRRLAEMVKQPANSPLGKIEQVSIERALADRSPRNVLDCFSRDVDLVAAVCGRMTDIAAMASGGRDGDYSNLGVQMSGPSGIVARWSIGPMETRESARLVLRGTGGWAALDMPADNADWTLRTVVAGESQNECYSDWDPGRAAIDHFVRSLNGEPTGPTWSDALYAMEVADTIELSLHRDRTIQLHGGRPTEEGTFKGMMASAGCGLLLLGLAITFGGLLLMWLSVPGAAVWPYLLLVLFILFLLLQLLKFVFTRDRE